MGRAHLEDLDADGLIMWTGSSGLSRLSLIYGNELSGYTRGREFLHELKVY
jgi:hypothetical protein